MRFFLLSLCVGTLLPTGACGDDAETWPLQTARSERAIINGTEDTGHPMVGQLASGAQALCTGTLVGWRTILTAAHCVTNTGGSSILYPISFTLSSWLVATTALKATVHPDYGKSNYGADIALVHLGKVLGATPASLASQAPQTGQSVVLVGFGITDTSSPGTGGTKRKAENTIAYMDSDRISFHDASGSVGNVCSGDSGGPSFAQQQGKEVVIGVHSTGSVPCGKIGNDVRVDLYRDWIISTSKGDVGSPKDSEDPKVSIQSPSSGSTVASSFQVKVQASDDRGLDRVELEVDLTGVGKATAEPFTFQVRDLAPGSHTLEAMAYDLFRNRASHKISVTVPDTSTKSGFGATCKAGADCTSGLCVKDPTTSTYFCSTACQVQGTACPAGYSCQQDTSGNVCLPVAESTPAEGCTVVPGAAPRAGGSGWSLLALALVLLRLRNRLFLGA